MKNKTFHLNFVDILIICIVLVVFLILFAMFIPKNSKHDLFSRDTVQVTLIIEGIPYAHNDTISKNDKVYLQNTDKEFGTVKSVTYAHKPHYDSESGEIDYYYPELLNAELMIECKASVGDGYIDINGVDYAVSDIVQFYSKNYLGEGIITSYEVA